MDRSAGAPCRYSRAVGTLLVALLAASMLAFAGSAPPAAAKTRVERPSTKFDPIPYGKARKRQMAAYSARHYGKRTWKLSNPRAIVLHYTASSSYSSVHSTFAANSPALGERPGVCSQFVVDKDGTIYQLTRLRVRCRHTVGLNQLSFGIEMVQEDLGGPDATDAAILARKAQIRSAVQLASWLRQRYRIGFGGVIGHSMANDSRLFEDREGWRNDHVDWQKPDVNRFRRKMKHLERRVRGRKRAEAPAAASGRTDRPDPSGAVARPSPPDRSREMSKAASGYKGKVSRIFRRVADPIHQR